MLATFVQRKSIGALTFFPFKKVQEKNICQYFHHTHLSKQESSGAVGLAAHQTKTHSRNQISSRRPSPVLIGASFHHYYSANTNNCRIVCHTWNRICRICL